MTNCRSLPLTALLFLVPLSAALAQPVALRWQAPTGCPTRREVEQLLSRVHHSAALAIVAAVERVGAGYRLRLRVQGEGRRFERELRAQSCAVLAESSVWLVELAASQLSAARTARPPGDGDALAPRAGADVAAGAREPAAARERGERVVVREDGDFAAGERRTGDSASRSTPPADSSEQRAPSDAAALEHEYLSAGAPETTHELDAAVSGEGSAQHGLHFRLGLGAGATDVGLSGLSPHLALDLTLVLAHWSVGLRLGVLLHPELTVAGDATVDLQTNAAQLLGCRLWDVARVLVGPCLTLSGLHSLARTHGLVGSEASSASWLAAGPALVLQLNMTQALRVGAEIGAWAALSPRPSFEVADSTLARAGTLAGYARLGASYELW